MSLVLERGTRWQLPWVCILFLTACAGRPVQPTPEPEHFVVDVGEPGVVGPGLDYIVLEGNAPLITGLKRNLARNGFEGSSLHVWVYREGAQGSIQSLRTTGLATSVVSVEASQALRFFAQNPDVRSRFRSFMVEDFSPQGEEEPFAREAERLLRQLKSLSASEPQALVIHELLGTADVITSDGSLSALQRRAGSASRERHVTEGPVFRAVRGWNRFAPSLPLRFELSIKDLGLTADQLDRLAYEAGLRREPWTPGALQAWRERAVDGLLRGWPGQARSEATSALVELCARQHLPAFWEKLLPLLPASKPTQDPRFDLFFRVRELSRGHYEVQPMTVSWASYEEASDEDGLAGIPETPLGSPQKLAVVRSQKEATR